jgi:uncharacterized protein (TIGR00290 family)
MGAARPRAAVSWSGGKDSCAALHRATATYDVVALVTMFDETGGRSRSHGLRPAIVDAQAERLGLRRFSGSATWDGYADAFSAALDAVRASGVTHVIFGDILFEEHRRWAEDACAAHGLTAVEPLWGTSTDELFDEWTASGADAIIITARAPLLDASWLGKRLMREMGPTLKTLGVDLCGERGEYHTLVTNHPLFRSPLCVRPLGHVERSGCWALDVLPREVDDAASD